MASTSGTKDEVGFDSEHVPSSLVFIVPILRVANEIEKDNDRVAYLCRFHAFERAYRTDRDRRVDDTHVFKIYLLRRLQKDEERTKPRLAKNDVREIEKFYQNFYEENIREGQYTKKPEEMVKVYKIATVLYEVMKSIVPLSKVEQKAMMIVAWHEDGSIFGTLDEASVTTGIAGFAAGLAPLQAVGRGVAIDRSAPLHSFLLSVDRSCTATHRRSDLFAPLRQAHFIRRKWVCTSSISFSSRNYNILSIFPVFTKEAEQVFYTPYPAKTTETNNKWAVVKTKPRGVFEVTEAQMEANAILQIDERFESPCTVTRSDQMFPASDADAYEQVSDEESEDSEEEEHEEEEFEDEDDMEDDENELFYSEEEFGDKDDGDEF
ncbi:hypothetical protein L2E82_11105 [Cichorium intybus]|uniref:Uncharacterized protein n=1 Tax=Cichorium intybus TaxID=13427 RepID=A0ACB9GBW5_CICIN|nr:hypothetical protein L2E82_11105 [Cichorium intybus]